VNSAPTAPAPDQRTVICWEPLLQSDANGEVTFSFVTSDVAGEYLVKLTVLEKNGNICQVFDTINVNALAD